MAGTLTLNSKVGHKTGQTTAGGSSYEIEFVAISSDPVTVADVQKLLPSATPEHIQNGDAHPADANSFITKIKVSSKDESKVVWDVTASYEPLGSSTSPLPPTQRIPDVRWGFRIENRPIFMDYSSPPKPIINSAGEKFDEFLERPFGELSLEYTRNETSPDFLVLRDHAFVVNSSPFVIDGQTIPTGRALLSIGQSIPKVFEGSYTYYRVTYVFWFLEQVLGAPTSATVGWNPVHVLDRGYNELSVGLEWVPICDDDGMPARKPWPLDGSGFALADPTASPAERAFIRFPERDFTPFNFS